MKELLGTPYLLEIDTETDPTTEDRGSDANYRPVACLNSNGVDSSTAEQDVSNKCDGGKRKVIPGQGSWNMSLEGIATDLEDSEEGSYANYQELIGLSVNKQVFFARITNEDQTTYREGKVFFTSYTETQPYEAPFTFSGSLSGSGELFLTPATS